MRRLLAVGIALPALAVVAIASAASLSASSARLTTDEVGTCTAAPAADAYVDQLLPQAGSSFGTAQTLSVRSRAAANRRAFVRFDLSSCGITGSVNVTGAELRLVLTTAPGSSRTHALHAVTGGWTEASTWNDQPSVAATATASAATGTTAGATVTWTSSTLVADVQAWVDGTTTNNGWRISDSAEGAVVSVTAAYGAREHATATSRPLLVVTYEP